jgi:hypothetical protein
MEPRIVNIYFSVVKHYFLVFWLLCINVKVYIDTWNLLTNKFVEFFVAC